MQILQYTVNLKWKQLKTFGICKLMIDGVCSSANPNQLDIKKKKFKQNGLTKNFLRRFAQNFYPICYPISSPCMCLSLECMLKISFGAKLTIKSVWKVC